MKRFSCLALATVLVVAAMTAPRPAFASEAPFEPQLLRLSEILGSLHFLRNLCGESGAQWRTRMEELLDAENPEPARRARMVARFNHGYSAFAANYTNCTASAIEAIDRYMREGEALTRDVVVRYGN